MPTHESSALSQRQLPEQGSYAGHLDSRRTVGHPERSALPEERLSGDSDPRLPARGAFPRLIAVRAVHGLVSARLERHEGFLPTASAGRGVHLPLRPVVPASVPTTAGGGSGATAAAALGAASGATLGILVAALGVILLVVGAECEVLATLGAGQGTVG